MRPIAISGDVWRVIRVPAGDPRLIDREGRRTVGTTDPVSRTIHLSDALAPPALDMVLMHEVAHAITMSHGLLESLGYMVQDGDRIGVEEWAAQLVENHALEASALASESLGRPVCVRGYCD